MNSWHATSSAWEWHSTLFGPKVVISGLPANKASKFGNEAKLAMTWARRVYETHRNTISGMTENSVAAAMPELALIFASQNGPTGRPLPALLQLPLEDSLRQSLHESIAQKISYTIPETNIFAPENRPGPKRKVHRLPTIHFQVLKAVSFSPKLNVS